MGQLGLGRNHVSVQVSGERIVEQARLCPGGQSFPVRAEPATKSTQQFADPLAYDHVAHADFAQLRIHIVDKNFGQESHCLRLTRILFQSDQYQRKRGRNHFEPAIDAIGNTAGHIPMWLAGISHDLFV